MLLLGGDACDALERPPRKHNLEVEEENEPRGGEEEALSGK